MCQTTRRGGWPQTQGRRLTAIDTRADSQARTPLVRILPKFPASVPSTSYCARATPDGAETAAGAPPEERFYLPELDVLRFFAFLWVYSVHVYLAGPHPMGLTVGYVGDFFRAGIFRRKDLFLVLSAYLITELLVRERTRTGRLDVRSFYVRRILRICRHSLSSSPASPSDTTG